MELFIHELDWRVRIFDALSYPTLILSPDRTIIAVNKVFLSKYNVTEEEVIGKTCHDNELPNHSSP